MFNDQHLISHLDSQTLDIETGCYVELNQNDLSNVDTLGVFKYPDYNASALGKWPVSSDMYWRHNVLTSEMQEQDRDRNEFQYQGSKKKSDYFSLSDCFTDFRPRSGIVKLIQPPMANNMYMDDFKSVRRPRYYAPSINDNFKYWTSWNTDLGPFQGLSSSNGSIKYAAPFVVYKTPVAANKICVKIQTGIGEAVPPKNTFATFKDPLSDLTYSNLPKRWRIQYLNVHGTWVTAFQMNAYDSSILSQESGILDIVYIPKNPNKVLFPNFILRGYVATVGHLPLTARNGEAYCVGRSTTSIGSVYVWNGSWTNQGSMGYEWAIIPNNTDPAFYAVKKFVDPEYYNPVGDADDSYNEFVFMRGLRILVDEMVAPNKSFDLIELSARLFLDLSDNVVEYSVDKAITDDGSILPVGDMSVSNGSVTLSNIDLALNKESEYNLFTHKGSLISNRIRKNTKFLLYEIVKSVNVGGVLYDKFIPVKNLYAITKPVTVSGTDDIVVTLRDLNFRFEETECPNIILKDCSLTKAVATLLDWCGFSNYVFYMGDNKTWKNSTSPLDTIIPYFFTNSSMTVSEALEMLATSTQCAIFFNEYNDLVVMPREHFGTDPVYTLRGHGIQNIETMEAEESAIADVSIKYTHRDMARSTLPLENINENSKITRASGEPGNVMAYKTSLVWDSSRMEGTTLSAAPLNRALTADVPVYRASAVGSIANNTFDLGLWSEYFPESGYVSLNGEIIRFDAKEYSMGGRNVWVESRAHLNELIGRSAFTLPDGSGQMIYPTGNMRIYTEVKKDENGSYQVVKHGRGQFGTTVKAHRAEPTDWINGKTYRCRDQAHSTLYGKVSPSTYTFGRYIFTNVTSGQTNGVRYATDTSATNYVYNSVHSQNKELFVSPLTITPTNVVKLDGQRRIMKSSALTFGGSPDGDLRDTYLKTKVINGGDYDLFGARIGVIGTSMNDSAAVNQDPIGSMQLGVIQSTDPSVPDQTISGAGGGLAFLLNRNVTVENRKTSYDGYYFEIIALNSSYTNNEIDGVVETVFTNVNFYKMNRALKDGNYYNVPIKLWSTYADILVTSGSQAARDRLVPGTSLVYDLAVEAKKVGRVGAQIRVFHLYLNDVLIGIVEESEKDSTGYLTDWSPDKTELGIFVRGASQIQVEHIYAVATKTVDPAPIYLDSKVMSRPTAFRYFSPSSIYSSAQIDGSIASNGIYFEEFGSIAREVKHVKPKFDMFPVFTSMIAPRPIFDRSYSISGYYADPYEAEFLIWSHADRLLDVASEETPLNITGICFENNTEQILTMDDYLLGEYAGSSRSVSYDAGINLRNRLMIARSQGETERVELDSDYIQNREYALKMMKWLSGFIGEERLELRINAFGVPHLQIGDIVTVDHKIPVQVGVNQSINTSHTTDLTQNDYSTEYLDFDGNGKRYIIKSISVDRTGDGPEYSLHLVQLPDTRIWNAGDF